MTSNVLDDETFVRIYQEFRKTLRLALDEKGVDLCIRRIESEKVSVGAMLTDVIKDAKARAASQQAALLDYGGESLWEQYALLIIQPIPRIERLNDQYRELLEMCNNSRRALANKCKQYHSVVLAA